MTMPDALQKRLDRRPVITGSEWKIKDGWSEAITRLTGVTRLPVGAWSAMPEYGSVSSVHLNNGRTSLFVKLVVIRRSESDPREIVWFAEDSAGGCFLLTEPQFEKFIEQCGGNVVAADVQNGGKGKVVAKSQTWADLIAPYADGPIAQDAIRNPIIYEADTSFRSATASEQERTTAILFNYEDGRLVCHATHRNERETEFWRAKIAPEKMLELLLALGHEIPSWVFKIANAADKTREPAWKVEYLPADGAAGFGTPMYFAHEGVPYELRQLAIRSDKEDYAAWFIMRDGERYAIRLDPGHENELLSRLGVEFTPPSTRIENTHDLSFPLTRGTLVLGGSAEDKNIARLDERYHCNFVSGGKEYVASFAPAYRVDKKESKPEWQWFVSAIGSREYRVFEASDFFRVLRDAGIDAKSLPTSLRSVPIPPVETQPAAKPVEAPPPEIVNAPRKPSVKNAPRKPKKESSRMKNAMAAAKAALPLASAYTAAQAAKEPLIAAINKTLKGNPFRGMVVDAIKSDYGTGALCVTIGLTLPLMSGHLPANLQSTAAKASDAFITRGTQAVAEKMGDLVLKPLIAAVRVFADAEAEGSAAMLEDGRNVRVGGFAASASEEEPVERSAGRSAANRRSGG